MWLEYAEQTNDVYGLKRMSNGKVALLLTLCLMWIETTMITDKLKILIII